MSAKPKQVPCPHDIDALLQSERQYIPGFGLNKRKGCLVWCDDCRHWVPFDFLERQDFGLRVQPTAETFVEQPK